MSRRKNVNATLSKDEALWAIYTDARNRLEADDLSDEDVRDCIISLMAERYNVTAADITSRREPVLYANVSKILRLVLPKYPRAAADLRKELQRGGLPFNDALDIARGNARTREEAQAARRGSAQPARPAGIDLTRLFEAVCSTAFHSGFDRQTIADTFEDALFNVTDRNA